MNSIDILINTIDFEKLHRDMYKIRLKNPHIVIRGPVHEALRNQSMTIGQFKEFEDFLDFLVEMHILDYQDRWYRVTNPNK